MGIFDGADTGTNLEEEKDIIRRGSYIMESDVYDMTIDKAFVEKKDSGAVMISLHTSCNAGELKESHCVISGDVKGNKSYYKRNGKQYPLPGFAIMDAVCLLACGKSVKSLKTTKKIVKLYDFDASAEVPKEVDMITNLLGKTIKMGVLKKIVDKKAKNEQTDKWEPTGETKEVNSCDKLFRAKDGMTIAEIKAQAPEAVFLNTWLEKNKGETFNEAKGAEGTHIGSSTTSTVSKDTAVESLFA